MIAKNPDPLISQRDPGFRFAKWPTFGLLFFWTYYFHYVASGKGDESADAYNMEQNETILLGAPLDPVEVGKSGKPAAIAREIGKRPVLAFSNSTGDYSMLNYAMGNPKHPGMGVFIVCDDTEREYGSDVKAAGFYSEAEKQGWTPVSMKNDWKTIYGEDVVKTELPGTEEALPDAA